MKLSSKSKSDRVSRSMSRFCTNILLERPGVGQVKKPYRILPPIGHTYGLENRRDEESAGQGFHFDDHPFKLSQ